MAIHPTAIVHKQAKIDATADVGAYAIINANVKIGPETRIYPHAYVGTGTTIGARCAVHPFAVLGHHPQDLAWERAPSYTVIGDETIIREGVTVHRGTTPESTTSIGRRVYLMASAHVAHNCTLGDDVKLTNGVLLGGYVSVGSAAFVGGNAGIHQFCRVGELVIVGGAVRVTRDVPPFMMVVPEGVAGPNVVGLRRAGLSSAERAEIRWAYKTLFRSGLTLRNAIDRVCDGVQTEPGRRLAEFLRQPSKRGYTRYYGRRGSPADEPGE